VHLSRNKSSSRCIHSTIIVPFYCLVRIR